MRQNPHPFPVSWEVFEACWKCDAAEGQPCLDMRVKDLEIECDNPHPKRRKKPRKK